MRERTPDLLVMPKAMQQIARWMALTYRRALSKIVRVLTHSAANSIVVDTTKWTERWSATESASRMQCVEAVSLTRFTATTSLVLNTDVVGATADDFPLACDLIKSRVLRGRDVKVHLVPRAFVHGIDGAIVSPDKKLMCDLSPFDTSPADHPMFRRLRFGPAVRLEGQCTSLVQPMSLNHYHWLLECLPVLGAIEDAAQFIDRLIVRKPLSARQWESIEALGFDRSQVSEVALGDVVQCERLVQPTFMNAWMIEPWVPRWLRSVYLGAIGPQPPRRLFVSRRDAMSRRVSNEDDLLSMLSAYGFESIVLSGLSLHEQAAIFDSAEFVIGPHGAGLANLAFCRPGTAVLELFPKDWTPLCFFRLSRACGHRYRLVTSSSVGLTPEERRVMRAHVPQDASSHDMDFEIPVEKVRAAVLALLKPPA